MTIKDGGPAFPNRGENMPRDRVSEGMSLRDWFATFAPDPPVGWVGSADDINTNIANHCFQADREIYAMIEWRWFYADEMLKARGET